MEIWMDVDTALSEVPVNLMPLIDSGDFVTVEDGVTYDQAGMDLRWNFVTTAGAYTSTAVTPTTGGNYDWAHQGDGMYSIEIPASGGASINNDTEGFGWFSGKITGVLPFRGPIIGFRASGLNDKLIDSAYSTTRGLSGTALPDAAAEAAGGLYTRGTGAGQLSQTANGELGVATLTKTLTTYTGNTPQTGDAFAYLGTNLGALGANATEAGGTGDHLTALATQASVNALPSQSDITGGAYSLDTDANGRIRIVDGTGAGELDTLSGTVLLRAATQASIDAIEADTNELQTDWVNGGRLDLLIDAIKAVTDAQGGTGSGLTAIPWNASWDAEVQSEVDDGLIAKGLDHLVFASVAGADVADNSIIAKLVSKSATADWDSYTNTTDALEALRDRGDAAWITAAGFSTHSAADVWAVATRVLTAGTNIVLAKGTGVTGFNDLDAAGIRTALGLATANLDTQLDALPTANEVRNAVTGGAYALDTDANGRVRIVDGTGAGEIDLTSGGVLVASLATQAKADVNAEVVDAFATDTYAEPSQGTPPATASLSTKLNWLYMAWRNKKTQTSSLLSLFADDASTVAAKSTVSDDGTTFTAGEFTTGA